MLINPNAQRWLRFLCGGGINTGLTYLTYLGLNTFLAYQASYLIAYSIGIVFSYWFNASIVFRTPLSWKGLVSHPIVYIAQYLVSALFLGGLIEILQISEIMAPIVVAITMIPVSYILIKFILGAQSSEQHPQGDATP